MGEEEREERGGDECREKRDKMRAREGKGASQRWRTVGEGVVVLGVGCRARLLGALRGLMGSLLVGSILLVLIREGVYMNVRLRCNFENAR